MKKMIILFAVLVSGCAAPTTFTYQHKSLISSGNKDTVCLINITSGVEETEVKYFLTDLLKENDFKIITDLKKCKYRVGYGLHNESSQYQESVPIFGKTGIKSVQTNSTGRYNGYATYNGYSGFYNGTANTNTYSTVDYDYGITGYENVTRTAYKTSFGLMFLDMKSGDVVLTSSLSIPTFVSKSELVNYVKSVYSQNPLLLTQDNEYVCENQSCIPYVPKIYEY